MSVTPETARQAVQAWGAVRSLSFKSSTTGAWIAAGDALAVLVPQLLDQLARTQEKNDRQAVTVTQVYDKCMALRAALNEIAERDSVVLMGRPRYGVFGKIARAALGDTPPPKDPLASNLYYAVEPPQSAPEKPESTIRVSGKEHRWDGHRMVPVEPPQPSPTDETCHHGRPFDLCSICSARIPYERPPQPETPGRFIFCPKCGLVECTEHPMSAGECGSGQ